MMLKPGRTCRIPIPREFLSEPVVINKYRYKLFKLWLIAIPDYCQKPIVLIRTFLSKKNPYSPFHRCIEPGKIDSEISFVPHINPFPSLFKNLPDIVDCAVVKWSERISTKSPSSNC
jgi:hypothetical protein